MAQSAVYASVMLVGRLGMFMKHFLELSREKGREKWSCDMEELLLAFDWCET